MKNAKYNIKLTGSSANICLLDGKFPPVCNSCSYCSKIDAILVPECPQNILRKSGTIQAVPPCRLPQKNKIFFSQISGKNPFLF